MDKDKNIDTDINKDKNIYIDKDKNRHIHRQRQKQIVCSMHRQTLCTKSYFWHKWNSIHAELQALPESVQQLTVTDQTHLRLLCGNWLEQVRKLNFLSFSELECKRQTAGLYSVKWGAVQLNFLFHWILYKIFCVLCNTWVCCAEQCYKQALADNHVTKFQPPHLNLNNPHIMHRHILQVPKTCIGYDLSYILCCRKPCVDRETRKKIMIHILVRTQFNNTTNLLNQYLSKTVWTQLNIITLIKQDCFEVLQKIVMELDGNMLTKTAQALKNRQYEWAVNLGHCGSMSFRLDIEAISTTQLLQKGLFMGPTVGFGWVDFCCCCTFCTIIVVYYTLLSW